MFNLWLDFPLMDSRQKCSIDMILGEKSFLEGQGMNKDCYVNLKDLMLLANDWLKCTDPADPVNCVLD